MWEVGMVVVDEVTEIIQPVRVLTKILCFKENFVFWLYFFFFFSIITFPFFIKLIQIVIVSRSNSLEIWTVKLCFCFGFFGFFGLRQYVKNICNSS